MHDMNQITLKTDVMLLVRSIFIDISFFYNKHLFLVFVMKVAGSLFVHYYYFKFVLKGIILLHKSFALEWFAETSTNILCMYIVPIRNAICSHCSWLGKRTFSLRRTIRMCFGLDIPDARLPAAFVSSSVPVESTFFPKPPAHPVNLTVLICGKRRALTGWDR